MELIWLLIQMLHDTIITNNQILHQNTLYTVNNPIYSLQNTSSTLSLLPRLSFLPHSPNHFCMISSCVHIFLFFFLIFHSFTSPPVSRVATVLSVYVNYNISLVWEWKLGQNYMNSRNILLGNNFETKNYV